MDENYDLDNVYDYSGLIQTMQEKQNVHTFLNNVVITKNTTKVGNLTEDEIGKPKIPLRTYKELELFCRDIMNQEDFANYFKNKGEILTSTSLSKDAKLISLAVVQRKELAELSKPKKENKGWFKKRTPEQI